MTSAGSRSLVNWMRWYERPSTRASACASVVLPTPGMSSISRWPRASRQASASRTSRSLPSRIWFRLASAASSWLRSRIRRPVPARSSQRGYPLVLFGKLRQFTLESLEPLALLRYDLGGRVAGRSCRCRAWRSRARGPVRACRDACRAGQVPQRRRSVRPSAIECASRRAARPLPVAAPRPQRERVRGGDAGQAPDHGLVAAKRSRSLGAGVLQAHAELHATARCRARRGCARTPRMKSMTQRISDSICARPQHPAVSDWEGLAHDRAAFGPARGADALPDLLGDERHQRMQQTQQRLQRLEQRSPRARCAPPACCRPTAAPAC